MPELYVVQTQTEDSSKKQNARHTGSKNQYAAFFNTTTDNIHAATKFPQSIAKKTAKAWSKFAAVVKYEESV